MALERIQFNKVQTFYKQIRIIKITMTSAINKIQINFILKERI